MKNNKWDWLVLVLRLFLAVVFIYAGVGKILNPAAFAEDIDNYSMLPYLLVTIMAAIMPWVEVLCGLLLIFGKWIKGATLLLIAMNFVFIIAIGSALARGLDISCGCFAMSDDGIKVGYKRLLEDVVFLVAAVIIYYRAVLSDLNKRTD